MKSFKTMSGNLSLLTVIFPVMIYYTDRLLQPQTSLKNRKQPRNRKPQQILQKQEYNQ